jgi:putative chitinase
MATKITKNILKSATGATDANADKFLPYVNDILDKYQINTPARILSFLAQVGHESGGFKYLTELASGSAYEGRKDLGNNQSGDGVKFKGRGAIQVTGRSNYEAVSKALGVDFVANPELLATPKYAIEASAWWWKKHGLNQLADKMDINKPLTDPQNKAAFDQITKTINGGYNGIDDRRERWQAGLDPVTNFAIDSAKFMKKNWVPFTLSLAAITIGTIAVIVNKDKIIKYFS